MGGQPRQYQVKNQEETKHSLPLKTQLRTEYNPRTPEGSQSKILMAQCLQEEEESFGIRKYLHNWVYGKLTRPKDRKKVMR
jgi:hypothetical protein